MNVYDRPPYDCDTGGPAFTHYKMDQGPVLNRIGRLCYLLNLLGVKATDDVFQGKAPLPTFHKRMNKRL